MIYKLAMALLLALWLSISIAGAEIKAFQADSMTEITGTRNGRPFILILWSTDCPSCLKELGHLQQLRNRLSGADIVLVATDGQQHAAAVQQILSDWQLERMDNWNFAGSMPERLRYAIDPGWYGELPRAYFYNAAHQRLARSGVLSAQMLQQWIDSLNNPWQSKSLK